MDARLTLIRLGLAGLLTLATSGCIQGFNSQTFASLGSAIGLRTAALNQQKFGMFYLTLQCLGTNRVYDVSAGQLGPVGSVHFWGKPDLGYYCPTQNPDVLRIHAEQLRDAGIDFIYYDGTNFPNSADPEARRHFLEPLRLMLDIWSRIEGAPKISVWIQMSGDMADAADAILSQYPNMLFQYQGKPLMEVVAGDSYINPDTWNRLAQKYTLRKMWTGGGGPTEWSFLSPCQEGFKQTNGDGECNQRVALGPDGRVEQVIVASAYSQSYMSNTATAVPKFGGKTFKAQMKNVDRFPEAPLVMISSWNEWVAYRFCMAPNGAPKWGCDVGDVDSINGNPIFVDQYDAEYNRDFEPGGGQGDKYYQLLKSEIALRKNRPVAREVAQVASNQVIGYLDRVSGGNGQVAIEGWACVTGVSQSIDVHVYLNGAAGQGHMVASGTANLASEAGVGQACEDATNSPHRFHITLDGATARANQGQSVFVHGISNVGGANLVIAQSGTLTIPDPGFAPVHSAVSTMSYSSAGPIGGQTCVQLLEPSDPHTWADNYLCSTVDLGLRWSFAGPIDGMVCTLVDEPADPDAWADNYLCAPRDLGLQWSYAGPIEGRRCVQIHEAADPHAWGDNYLCGP